MILKKSQNKSRVSTKEFLVDTTNSTGQEMVSIEKVADNLQRLGLLVTDFPRIKEMDLNPLKGTNENLYAVDARIITDH